MTGSNTLERKDERIMIRCAGSTLVFLGLALAMSFQGSNAVAGNPLGLLPTPKSVKVTGGDMPLTAATRIVVTDQKLMPLARIFSGELLIITHIRMEPVEAKAEDATTGDIVLKINPKLRADNEILTVQDREVTRVKDYAHTISISDKCVVEGWDYRATCEGTATLLQALIVGEGKAALPKMEIKDWPHADYTGVMVDCARQDMPLIAIQDAVDAARFWKVRYLHLHFSDGSGIVFPLKDYPQAGALNSAVYFGDTQRVWDREELIKLVEYADARGVTLVPELETPAHCDSYMATIATLGDPGACVMDIAGEQTYVTLEKMINDICDVFKSSPFFHIGGDEIRFEAAGTQPGAHSYIDEPHVREFMKKNNMREKDKGGADDLLKYHVLRLNEIIKKRGKKTIFWGGWQGPPLDPALNDCIVYSWYAGAKEAQKAGFTTITVPWELKVPFPEWDMYHCNGELLERTDRVLGYNSVIWEISCEQLVLGCIDGFGNCLERTWGPDTRIDEPEFRARAKTLQARMDRLVRTVKMKTEGDIKPTGACENSFTGPLTITLTADPPDGYAIHYTLDGTRPTAKFPVYEKPIEATGRTRARAALIAKSGELLGGYSFSERYNCISFEKSLCTGKPVETSGGVNPDEKPEFAVDGYGDIKKFWGMIPAPQWLKVDLQGEFTVDRISILPYWDNKRYYQYTIEVSADGKEWTKVVDASQNTEPGTEAGYAHKFDPIKARYVKVNMLKNSDNPAVHLVDLRVYEAGK